MADIVQLHPPADQVDDYRHVLRVLADVVHLETSHIVEVTDPDIIRSGAGKRAAADTLKEVRTTLDEFEALLKQKGDCYGD